MIFLLLLLLVVLALVALSLYYRSKRKNSVAFFHPNCLDCGGGEKVLWEAVMAVKDKLPEIHIYAQNATNEEAEQKVKKSFQIELPSNLHFINAGSADFIKPGYFKHLTLIFQALGSIVYAFKCLNLYVPEVIIDTTGAPFASFVWKIFGGCKVILYIHYPFISTDMLHRVTIGQNNYNNDERIAKSPLLTHLKLLYYTIIASIYSFVGTFADVITVNSTWTANHIRQIFKKEPIILFPPCDTKEFADLPLEGRNKYQIVSVQQFRPEKNLPLQLDIAKILKDKYTDLHLYIVGGCRNEQDKALLEGLQKRIDDENLPVTLVPNAPYDDLKNKYLAKSNIGIHTMLDEHFGICVVEYLAAGLIPVANKSAGPLLDIVQDENYLALTAEEYAEKIEKAFNASDDVRENFRNKCQRFSNDAFIKGFIEAVEPLLKGNITSYKD